MSLAKNGFTFKQFFIAHDRCAMKVNTDAIILGAWADVAQAKSILDIGTGSGLIALMLAQRTSETVCIDAIELEQQACLQADDNFTRSPWRNKLRTVCQDVTLYAEQTDRRYDLIVTNPPYFDTGCDCHSDARSLARYTSALSHRQLLNCCRRLLTENGRACFVLPFSVATAFLRLAQNLGWHCGHKLAVRDSEIKTPHLLLFELAPYQLIESEDCLTLRQSDRQYSREFRELTKDFYLFF
jgi:tRNA1Val (adenine37-N6)-methyltransferase